MARFRIFASSSRGNSSYLSCGDTSLLIDAGISCRRICRAVADSGGDISRLAAVLITHEHKDHIDGLLNLIKKTGSKVYAPGAVLDYIATNGCVPGGTQLCEVGDKPFCIGDIEVRPFATPHDSRGSAGYRFTLPGGETVGIATDLGCVTDQVRAGLEGCRIVLLESNYDDALLSMSSYAPMVKARIRSDLGHLENRVSARFAAELAAKGTTRLFLGHLSRENNNPALAVQTALETLRQSGAVRGVDFELEAADYDLPSRLVRF